MVPDYLPGVHPLIVHFPIALLVVGACVEALAAIRQRSQGLRQAAGALLALGTVLLVPSYLSGRQAVDALQSPFALTDVAAAEHADAAWLTLWFFVGLGVVRTVLAYRQQLTGVRQVAIAVMAVGGLALVIQTAEQGGRLVYDLGAGVRPVREAPAGAFDPPPQIDPAQLGPVEEPDGGLYWSFQPGSEGVLGNHLTALSGRMPEAAVVAASSALVLDAAGASPLILVAEPEMERVGVSVLVDLSELNGEFALVYLLRSPEQYEFLRLREGRMEIGRRDGDEETLLASEAFVPASGPHELRAVGAGTHSRGYVDGELIVHGHGSALPAGRAGLLIAGAGNVRLNNLRVRPLGNEE